VLGVQIEAGVPLPPVRSRANGPYAVLWDRMKAGDMVRLPDRQAHGLHAHAKKLKQASAMRRLGAGIKGVWKL